MSNKPTPPTPPSTPKIPLVDGQPTSSLPPPADP